jgi:hypothetical protein
METVRIGSARFFWLHRTPRSTFASDPKYAGPERINALLRRIVDEAAQQSVLLDDPEHPKLGWVRKRELGDFYVPCREFTDGAKPAWIWHGATL